MGCKETLEIGDDFGDNSCTFHCRNNEEGHEGEHKETTEWDDVTFTVTWKYKEVKENDG